MEAPIYLDHHATTPCEPRVVEAMLPYFTDDFGNAASPHHYGRRASNAIEDARVTVARFFGVQSNEIVLTSGGTPAKKTPPPPPEPGPPPPTRRNEQR